MCTTKGNESENRSKRESAEAYVQLIDKLLLMGTRDALLRFVQLYMQENFVKYYMTAKSELISGRVLAMIACDELALGRDLLYSGQFQNLEQFILAWDKLKFQLWELEFFGGTEAERSFFNHISACHVSDIALKYLLHTSAVYKKQTLLQIVNIALKLGKDVQLGLRLLGHGCELYPEDKEIPQLLVKLQAAVGG